MSMSLGILDLLAPAVSGDGLNAIATQLGLSVNETEQGIATALPALLGQLKASSDDPVVGPVLASAIVQHHGGGVFQDLSGFLNGGHRVHTPAALATSFGRGGEDHTSGPMGAIARLAGLGGMQTKTLLGILAPLSLGALGRIGGPTLSAGQTSAMLGTAIQQLRRGSPAAMFQTPGEGLSSPRATPAVGDRRARYATEYSCCPA